QVELGKAADGVVEHGKLRAPQREADQARERPEVGVGLVLALANHCSTHCRRVGREGVRSRQRAHGGLVDVGSHAGLIGYSIIVIPDYKITTAGGAFGSTGSARARSLRAQRRQSLAIDTGPRARGLEAAYSAPDSGPRRLLSSSADAER